MDDAPVECMRVEELAEVERGGLFEELGVRGVGCYVPEGEEHDGGEVHAGDLNVEDAGCSLDLGFETMGGCAEPVTPFIIIVYRNGISGLAS